MERTDLYKNLGLNEKSFNNLVEKTLISKGNNYFLKNFINKLKSGEPVDVVTFGGSVTEGAGPRDAEGKEIFTLGYAYTFEKLLKEKYPQGKISHLNAALSGTSSSIGLIRYEKDVEKTLNKNPDLLIIEFAVNDGEDITKTRALEYLFRKCIENKTAVIIVYAAATYNTNQNTQSPVAQFYEISELSMEAALKDSGVNLEKDSGIYFADYVHPTQAGHFFMAKSLLHLIETVEMNEADCEKTLPESYKNEKPFKTFGAIFADSKSEDYTINSGAFCTNDSEVQISKTGVNEFPHNWHKNINESGENFTIEISCACLYIAYKNQGNWREETFGIAEVFVDDKKFGELNGRTGSGWDNTMNTVLIDEDVCKKHKVEIKCPVDKEFTILGFGYSK